MPRESDYQHLLHGGVALGPTIEEYATTTLALDLKFVRPGEFFVRLARGRAVGGLREASLNLLTKK